MDSRNCATATFPRLSAGGNKYNQGNGWGSSFWLRSGNYIRLKNVSLGYNLPDSFCRNYLGGARVKVFVSGQNLFTKAANELVDPKLASVTIRYNVASAQVLMLNSNIL